jgi:hypothetical protein
MNCSNCDARSLGVIIPWNRVSSVLNEAVVLPPPDTDLSSDILGRAQSAHILRTPAEWPRERPPPTSQPRVCKTRLSESDGCKASQVVTVVTEIQYLTPYLGNNRHDVRKKNQERFHHQNIINTVHTPIKICIRLILNQTTPGPTPPISDEEISRESKHERANSKHYLKQRSENGA